MAVVLYGYDGGIEVAVFFHVSWISSFSYMQLASENLYVFVYVI